MATGAAAESGGADAAPRPLCARAPARACHRGASGILCLDAALPHSRGCVPHMHVSLWDLRPQMTSMRAFCHKTFKAGMLQDNPGVDYEARSHHVCCKTGQKIKPAPQWEILMLNTTNLKQFAHKCQIPTLIVSLNLCARRPHCAAAAVAGPAGTLGCASAAGSVGARRRRELRHAQRLCQRRLSR